MEPVVVTVRHTAYRDRSAAHGNGLRRGQHDRVPRGAGSSCRPADSLQPQLDRRQGGLDWLTVTTRIGYAFGGPGDVTLTASQNTGKARTGTLTIHPDDPALEDVVITVSQKAKSLEPIAWWSLVYERC